MSRTSAVMRRSERLDVSQRADCRTPWGKVERVVLADISVEGCRVTGANEALLPGDHVLIRTASLIGASGSVRWVNGVAAGVEFDSPLDGAVLRHFERNRADGAKIIVPSQDKFKVLQI